MVELEEIAKVGLVIGRKMRRGDEEKGEEKEWKMQAKGRDHGGQEGATGGLGRAVRALKKAFRKPI